MSKLAPAHRPILALVFPSLAHPSLHSLVHSFVDALLCTHI